MNEFKVWIRSFEVAEQSFSRDVDMIVSIKTNAPAFLDSRLLAWEDDHGEGKELCEE